LPRPWALAWKFGLRRDIRFRNQGLAVELSVVSGAVRHRAGMRRIILRRNNIRRTICVLYL
jgi:hypothetical protein